MPSFFVNSWIIFHNSFNYSIDGHLSTQQFFLLFHVMLKLTLLYVYFGSMYQNFCSTYSQLLKWNGESKYIYNAILLDISILSSQNALVINEMCIVQARNKHVHFPAQDGAVLFRFTILMSRQLYVIVLICISLLVTWNIFSCLLAIYSFLFCELSAFCAHFSTICLSFKIFLVRILYTFWIVIHFLQYMLKTVFLISCVISFTQCFSSVNIFLILAVKSVHFFPLRSGSHSPYQNYTTILQFSNTFRILSPIYFL